MAAAVITPRWDGWPEDGRGRLRAAEPIEKVAAAAAAGKGTASASIPYRCTGAGECRRIARSAVADVRLDRTGSRSMWDARVMGFAIAIASAPQGAGVGS